MYKEKLDNIDKCLFPDFIKIMIFDSLVGETDRHEENWGITKEKEHYLISPLYDNGCSLLNKFKNENYANKYYNNEESFEAYIRKSQTYIYNDKKKYKHFELIQDLKKLYPKYVNPELIHLKKLTDEKIEEVVYRIPDDLLTAKHKEYIIQYLKKRRDILVMEIGEGLE